MSSWAYPGKSWDRLGDVGQASHSGFADEKGFKGFRLASYSASANVKCGRCDRWKWDHDGRKCDCGPAAIWPNVKAVEGRRMQEWHERWAREALRVLRPGGFLLAFGGTRTYHRLACAVEDAGFEIRDRVMALGSEDGEAVWRVLDGELDWLYGTGFPKSLDVSKAIDKRAQENDETTRRITAVAAVIREHRERAGMERAQVSEAVVGTPSGACWNWEHQQLPSVEMWPRIKATLGIPDDFDGLIAGDRARFIAAERAVIALRARSGRPPQPMWDESSGREWAETSAATPEAERWEGWGSALKPAHEPIVVARKPLAGTVAGNVLAHGVGAMNIDGCRIGTTDRLGGGAEKDEQADKPDGWDRPWRHDAEAQRAHAERIRANVGKAEALGRWPANVVLVHVSIPVLRLRDDVPHGIATAIRAFYGRDTSTGPPSLNLRERDVPRLRADVRGAAIVDKGRTPEILLEGVQGDAPGDRAGGRSPDVRSEAHGGVAGEDERQSPRESASATGATASSLEGWPSSSERVHDGRAERPDAGAASARRADDDPGIRAGASAGHGNGAGSSADAGRDRASRERREGGQPAGEPHPDRAVESLAGASGGGARVGAAAAGEPPFDVPASAVPVGWREFFEDAGYDAGCRRVGTRRVKAGTAVQGRRDARQLGRNAGWGYRNQTEDQGFADADGMEQVEAWECADGCPVAELDRQSAASGMHSAGSATDGSPNGNRPFEASSYAHHGRSGRVGDSGSAARFFYTAKSSAAERSAGLPTRCVLRLREDLTDEQVAHVMRRLEEHRATQ